MEEKIGENKNIFTQNANFNANCDQIRLVTKCQKRQHCLWFNRQFRKQCLQEYWNKIISIWRKISEAEMKKSANIIVIPM